MTKQLYDLRAVFNDIKHKLAKMSHCHIQDIADEAGVTVQCLKQWEDGTTDTPLFENFINVSRAMGYEIKMIKS